MLHSFLPEMRALTTILALLVIQGAAEARRGSFRGVDRLMRQVVRQGTCQSAVLLVSQRGRPLFHKAYGKARLDTVFDLASLTKPLAATTTMMRLVDQKRVSVNTRMADLLPSLRSKPVGDRPLWQLMSHSSGLPARNRLTDQVQGLQPAKARARAKRLAADYPQVYQPGKKTLYSDLNFILLGWALERAGGARLDRLAEKLVFRPLGLAHTGFAPKDRGWNVAPTERVPGAGRLRGTVHDEKARAMGGIAGHAGMFASARDVQRIVNALVAAYNGRDSIFSPAVVRGFFDARPVKGSRRALGWDRPSGTSTGALFERGGNAVGHTGYTGTSLWVDPKRELSVVLLTNRVYFGRDPSGIRRLRPRLHDAIGQALGGQGRLQQLGRGLRP